VEQSAIRPAPAPLLDKADVQDLLSAEPVSQLTQDRFPVPFGDRRLIVETTIDKGLQQQLTSGFDKRHSRYIAIVVMDAANGDILALAGFDRTGSDVNPCIGKRFPAASIFKIVTAAAAVEIRGMSAGTPLMYNGAKHTLYKSQLKDRQNRYTRQTTLKDSFAQSVNPVFGKLGVNTLGQENLKRYGEAFGFNRQIRFEIPVSPSELTVDDDPYSWAEVASGFNQSTQISPLHGALMAASLVNEGAMMEPTIVRRVVDESGRILYQNQALEMNRPVSDKTSAVVRRLMAETVSKGTARKSFKGYRKDRILSQLDIGGKTGSIDNRTHDVRLDWFVGYAEYGGDKIALAAVVAHEDYIGKRAATYAKAAMSAYFQSKVGS
jgi:cell division protein FtsI/penicillin-binding protein 2